MIASQFHQWVRRPEMLDRDTLYELRTLVARYPYFQSARLLLLRNLFLLHEATFGEELRQSILHVADRRTLFELVEGDRFKLHEKQQASELTALWQEEPAIDRTLMLIDAFLANIPQEDAGVPLEYAGDYTAYLLREDLPADQSPDNVPALRGQSLIDDFISRTEEEPTLRLEPVFHKEEVQPVESSVPDAESEDDSYFTETLAKIYVRQKRYSKALEIIKKLSLKYPKKNAYFADQIRFLEKLIINTQSK
ncbi:MAG: tetratricopeptide repeat protein [Bacteroides sp.]|nr:tetratricopeptide repeat protein [Bacteroides sp.]